MNAVGITENMKGDHRKFEIWYSGREEVYVVQYRYLYGQLVWTVVSKTETRKIRNNTTSEETYELTSFSSYAATLVQSTKLQWCNGR
ncbi:proto-oncogene DBL [Trachemys scripta elegans]|uniref:proto-oncogene DBL n=1 Tax=Trachemys scripta elegans TaxID=31138 RepID=UPI001555CF62|nr:proto-oncogene DBL [Trachemys scripta elegans]